MARSGSLTLAFIDKRPAAAARVLTSIDADDAAALLDSIPTRYAAIALAHMSAWAASCVVSQMSVENVAATLKGLHYQNATAILRLLDHEVLAQILEAMPTAIQRDFRTTLAFPADTVGAHMTTSILALREDHNVKDARNQIRRAREVDANCVIVVDEAHRLLGLTDPAALLRSSGSTQLTRIMDVETGPLSARARLAAVADLQAWDRYSSLPVISRQRVVIGALNRTALRSLLQSDEPSDSVIERGLGSSLAEALAACIGGLARLLNPDDVQQQNRSKGL